MKKLLIVLVISVLFSTAHAVKWNWHEIQNDEFGKHFFGGVATTEIGWQVVSLFTDKKVLVNKWQTEDGGWHSEYKREVPQSSYVPKLIAGVALTAIAIHVTHQEEEPDVRALTAGCFSWSAFRMLTSFWWIK